MPAGAKTGSGAELVVPTLDAVCPDPRSERKAIVDSQALEQEISLEDEFALLDERASAVYLWRLEHLSAPATPRSLRSRSRMNHDIDLHLACDLLRRGCPERTAYLILA
jgi:hypothetical protein